MIFQSGRSWGENNDSIGLLLTADALSFDSAKVPAKISAENLASKTVKIGLYRDALF